MSALALWLRSNLSYGLSKPYTFFKMLILIVEDDLKRMKELKKCLESETLHVMTAQDGSEAMRLLKQQKFDVIFSDINMPFMSGYALAENVRKNDNLKSIPFLMYSSRPTSNENKELALEAGASKFIDSISPEGIKNEAMPYLVR